MSSDSCQVKNPLRVYILPLPIVQAIEDPAGSRIQGPFPLVRLVSSFHYKESLIDQAPLSVPSGMSLAKVHFLFIMLSLDSLFVTDPLRGNALIGVITRESFADAVENEEFY